MLPKVSVIVLNWNQPRLTVDCVKSVLDQDYREEFEVILVDNHSDDGSVGIFKEEFQDNEKVGIVECIVNRGYAGGNNHGVSYAGGEYVVILNNDTVVERDWLRNLVEGLESDESIGSVSSTEIRNGVKKDNGFITLSLTSRYIAYPDGYDSESGLVDFFGVKGASFIYRKSLANLPFDPEYFIYAEDTYLGWYLQLRGYKNKLSTRSIFNHLHNVSSKGDKIRGHFVYLGERNVWLNFFIFYEFKNIIRIFPLMVARTIMLNLREPMKIQHRLKSYWWLWQNHDTIHQKRARVQRLRRVGDDEIISRMSSKFHDGNGILRIANCLSHLYCKLVGLKCKS